jgi:hypothetical protein
MNTAQKRFVVLLLSLALPCVGGCHSSGPKMVRIHGTVYYNGKPLTNVTQGIVRYLPKDTAAGEREATGRIQPDGSFAMTTFKSDDGVVVGDYDITVSAYATAELSREQTESGQHAAGPKLLIPNRYRKPDTSGLKDTVDSGHSGSKKLELTDKA